MHSKIFLKRLIISFFIYMILEGVLRKWIFPNLSSQIYFIKDIFLIIIYLIALKNNLIIKLKYSKLFIIFVVAFSLYGFIPYELNKVGIISYILGLRSYWLFLPLFLIITHVFNKNDLIKFFKLNLYSVLPYFLLIYTQSILPDESVLNSGFDWSVQSPERPSAYFTYATQNTYYFLFLFCSYCAFTLSKKELLKKDVVILSIFNFLLISIMILLKSRAVYFYISLTVLYCSFFIIFSNLEKILKLKKLFLILLVSYMSFGVASKIFFVDQYGYSMNRMNSDSGSQMKLVMDNSEKKILIDVSSNNIANDVSIKTVEFLNELGLNLIKVEVVRIVEGGGEEVKVKVINSPTVYDYCARWATICSVLNDLYISPEIDRATLFGKGIGLGTRPVLVYNKLPAFTFNENDNKRIIVELGYLTGVFLVLIKFLTAIILNILAFFKFRDKHELVYVPIVVFTSTQLILGPLTYTTSFISFIFWFLLGLVFLSFKKDTKTYN